MILARAIVRWALAAFMVGAGTVHLVASDAFRGQVPSWMPSPRAVIWVSGVAEVGLGASLALTGGDRRRRVGWLLAAFYVLIFPGNIYQAVAGTDAFGLDTPAARWARLAFQPVLIAAALWSSGAWPRHRDQTARGADVVPPT
jgi:uncharacterized membrane protein